MGQIAITSRIEKVRLTKREQLIVLEIGDDMIDSASAFVGYLSDAYGFSKSSVWYNLNRLKEKGVVDFASKEEQGKPLGLTEFGSHQLRSLVKQGMRIDGLTDAAARPNFNIGDGVPCLTPNDLIMQIQIPALGG